jgi:acetolactate synthase-1/3 small subunit
MKHILSMLVENRQGVLARIAGLFSGRGYNLESITVGPTTDSAVSRLTLVCGGDDMVVEQIKKQLNRLIDVIKVFDLTGVPALNQELALVKVSTKTRSRSEAFQIAEVFKAEVMDVGHDTMTLQITGAPEKIDDFTDLLGPYGIVEMARSGLVSMERGKKTAKTSSPQAAQAPKNSGSGNTGK